MVSNLREVNARASFLEATSRRSRHHLTPQMLRFANFLSFNVNPTYEAICDEISRQLAVATQFACGESFDDFFQDRIDVGYICGLPYSKFADLDEPPVELLVAPVLAEERCNGQAVYFSDVVVPANSPAQTFDELQGRAFTYNEWESYSGYHVMGWHLQQRGYDWHFFGEQIKSGAHVKSIELLASGQADVAALDSHSLAAALKLDPSLQERIRVIDSIGPSPHPPVVVGRRVSAELKAALRHFYLNLHTMPTLQPHLATAAIERYVEVDDAYYDTIRERVDATEIRFSSRCG